MKPWSTRGRRQSPCLVRTKRLQDIGVIRGYGADIALEKLDHCVTVFSEGTSISLRRGWLGPEGRDQMIKLKP